MNFFEIATLFEEIRLIRFWRSKKDGQLIVVKGCVCFICMKRVLFGVQKGKNFFV